jgi:hypothetical protein
MLASSRQRRSAYASTAVVVACLVLPGVAASADVPYPVTSAREYRTYDPFDEPAPAVAAATTTIKPRGDYDPFDLLSPAPAAAAATCAFQQRAPTLSEPLPVPQGANQHAEDSTEPGADWSPTPLSELTTNIVLPSGLLPRDHWADRPPHFVGFFDPYGATRGWPVQSFLWEASSFCHDPLYFEEINLERYGYGCCACIQPAVSACHFFATVPALPYKMAVDCPCDCDYTLGHYRPGSCPPWRYHCCSRVSGLGAMSEAGVVTGMIFLIP